MFEELRVSFYTYQEQFSVENDVTKTSSIHCVMYKEILISFGKSLCKGIKFKSIFL